MHLLTLAVSVNWEMGSHASVCDLWLLLFPSCRYACVALMHAYVVLCVSYACKCKLSCKYGIEVLCILYCFGVSVVLLLALIVLSSKECLIRTDFTKGLHHQGAYLACGLKLHQVDICYLGCSDELERRNEMTDLFSVAEPLQVLWRFGC